MGTPHRGHRLRGCTTDSPAGTRAITTLRKLPTSRPRTAQTATSTDGTVAGPGGRSVVVVGDCTEGVARWRRRPRISAGTNPATRTALHAPGRNAATRTALQAPPASRVVVGLGSVIGAGDAAGGGAGLEATAAGVLPDLRAAARAVDQRDAPVGGRRGGVVALVDDRDRRLGDAADRATVEGVVGARDGDLVRGRRRGVVVDEVGRDLLAEGRHVGLCRRVLGLLALVQEDRDGDRGEDADDDHDDEEFDQGEALVVLRLRRLADASEHRGGSYVLCCRGEPPRRRDSRGRR